MMPTPWIPHSLRNRLLAFVVIPIPILVGTNLFWSSQYIDSSTGQAFDERLRYIVESVARFSPLSCDGFASGTMDAMFNAESGDELECKILAEDGHLLEGDGDVPGAPSPAVAKRTLQLYDSSFRGEAVRVAALTHYVERSEYTGWLTVTVSHTTRGIEVLRENVFTQDLIAGVLQIAVISLVLIVAITVGLRPLKRLQLDVQTRDSQDLSPLATDNLPSELMGVTEALNSLFSRLAQHIAIGKRFVENAAHQLRTPIAALLPQTELALREIEDARARGLLSKVQINARRLARLSGQLLNMTHAESIGIGNQELAGVNLADIARRRVELFQDRYPDAEVQTSLRAAPVKGIEFFVGEVIENLMHNARKYGGDRVRIRVRTGVADERGYLEVEDDGPGVSEGERENIVERFYRVADDHTGTGLGLAIVQEIMAGHGGQLVLAEGSEGKGLKVRCWFRATTA